MHLEMHIGRVCYAKVEIDFTGTGTTNERMVYLENLAEELYVEHFKVIKRTRQPVFYIDHVQSRMNEEGFKMRRSQAIT